MYVVNPPDTSLFIEQAPKHRSKSINFIEAASDNCPANFVLVEAILNGLKAISKKFRKTDRIVILNDSDYPIKSNEYIINYFRANPDAIIVQYDSVESKAPSLKHRFPFYDDVKDSIDIYTGSNFLSVPFNAIKTIFDFLNLNADFITYFKAVIEPQFSFFQTLLINSGSEKVKKNLVNISTRLNKIDSAGCLPFFTSLDLKEICESKHLFAGPFHPIASKFLLDELDKTCRINNRCLHRRDNWLIPKKSNDVILILTSGKESALDLRVQIQKTVVNKDLVILFHNCRTNKSFSASFSNKIAFMEFNDSILVDSGYTPISNELIPGSNHFPILKFYLENPHYDYYWYIEDDVKFLGDWEFFFSWFDDVLTSDFLSTYVSDFDQAPGWNWWDSLKHDTETISNERLVRSFNPVFRISNRGLKLLDERLRQGWVGHHEVLIPTLLKQQGYTLGDFGGLGRYVPKGYENTFYSQAPFSKDGKIGFGSFRYRPFIHHSEMKKRLLYHPVKG